MTVTRRPACADRGCAGRTDPDGFCLTWGYPCDGSSGPVESPDQAPQPVPELDAVPVPGQRIPTSRRVNPWDDPVWIAPSTARDPQSLLSGDFAVPESQRYCPSCRNLVRRVDGFCPSCGTRYSLTPPLQKGDVLDGHEIVRAIGHGGVGWVFLAEDLGLDRTQRVLKGLRNPRDRAARAAFELERRALVGLDHPGIVAITRVIPPRNPDDVMYLAMEYVRGHSLEDVRLGAGEDGRPAAAVATQVLGWGTQILDALGYLHDSGWLYCDLKPDNVMLTGTTIKLIDFGAVRRIDDTVSPPWGTRGFEAPEIQERGPAGPSVRSDLYTVGRTLGALALAVRTTEFLRRFPADRDVRTLVARAALDPFSRLVARATAAEPADRFATAAEMREQLHGVRRQLLAVQEQTPQPGRSVIFSPAVQGFALHLDPRGIDPLDVVHALPVPLVDAADPAVALLASIGALDPAQQLAVLDAPPVDSPAVAYTRIRALLQVGRLDEARAEADARPELPGDWPVWWHRGLVALAAGDHPTAQELFERVCGWLPGELAARLANAVAAELAGDHPAAAGDYRGVWQTDDTAVAAAFGLARTLLASDDRPAAAEALLTVPPSAAAAYTARAHAVDLLIAGSSFDDLARAAAIADKLPDARHLRIRILQAAVDRTDLPADHPGTLFGAAVDHDSLRWKLHEQLRDLARQTRDRATRVALVDQSHMSRPMTWW